MGGSTRSAFSGGSFYGKVQKTGVTGRFYTEALQGGLSRELLQNNSQEGLAGRCCILGAVLKGGSAGRFFLYLAELVRKGFFF